MGEGGGGHLAYSIKSELTFCGFRSWLFVRVAYNEARCRRDCAFLLCPGGMGCFLTLVSHRFRCFPFVSQAGLYPIVLVCRFWKVLVRLSNDLVCCCTNDRSTSHRPLLMCCSQTWRFVHRGSCTRHCLLTHYNTPPRTGGDSERATTARERTVDCVRTF